MCDGALKELYFVSTGTNTWYVVSVQVLLGHQINYRPGVVRKVCGVCFECVYNIFCVRVLCVCVCFEWHPFVGNIRMSVFCLLVRHCRLLVQSQHLSAGKHTTIPGYLLQCKFHCNINEKCMSMYAPC